MSFVRIVVYHSSYGCDSGCCGHVIEMQDDSGKTVEDEFSFSHDYDGEGLRWAQDLVREHFGDEHVKDLDWKDCLIDQY